MAKEKTKKIIIIGSNSFSAGSLIKLLLKKNFNVYGISRSNLYSRKFLRFNPKNNKFKFYKLDLNKNNKRIINLIQRIKPQYIVNFASQSMVGQSWDNPLDWYYTNSYSTIKLYHQISKLKFKIKLIHISTPEVYGNFSFKIIENRNYNPTTPYAASRVTADQFLNILNKNKKINYCSIRSSNVYGECQKLYRIIPKTIFSILKNKKLKLDGGGVSIRNFIHIDDVSEATYKVIKNGKNGSIYHICSDKYISIKDLVKLICKKMNYKFNDLVQITKERLGKDKHYILSNRKIKKELNWKPRIDLETGLEHCIIWVKKNLKSFLATDEMYIHKK